MSFKEECARRLLGGEDGALVVASMRQKRKHDPLTKEETPYYTLQSLGTTVSNIKSQILKRDPRHSEYNPAVLDPYASEPGVADFLKAPVAEQLKIQKRHRTQPTWSAGAEAALKSIKLLPDTLEGFKLTEAEMNEIKHEKETNKYRKMANVLRISHADALLHQAIQLLQDATVYDSITRLAIPLLFVSGRRSAEILNGKSTFKFKSERSVMFWGQLKKKGQPVAEYEIPLLCPAPLFLHVFSLLRSKQGDVGTPTEEDIHARYCGNLCRDLYKLFPTIKKSGAKEGSPHLLRSVYLHCVFKMYDHTYAFHLLAMKCLGHTDVNDSFSYASIELDDIDHLKRALGPLALIDGAGNSM